MTDQTPLSDAELDLAASLAIDGQEMPGPSRCRPTSGERVAARVEDLRPAVAAVGEPVAPAIHRGHGGPDRRGRRRGRARPSPARGRSANPHPSTSRRDRGPRGGCAPWPLGRGGRGRRRAWSWRLASLAGRRRLAVSVDVGQSAHHRRPAPPWARRRRRCPRRCRTPQYAENRRLRPLRDLGAVATPDALDAVRFVAR